MVASLLTRNFAALLLVDVLFFHTSYCILKICRVERTYNVHVEWLPTVHVTCDGC